MARRKSRKKREPDEQQSAANAWLAIEVDESVIQTVEEPGGAITNPSTLGAFGGMDGEIGEAETEGREAEPLRTGQEAESQPSVEFPREDDYGKSITRTGAAPVDCVDLLCFAVASETFAIDIREVREIIRARPATELPAVPDFIRGIIALRGQILPVLDLRRRLGFEAADAPLPSARIVVIAIDEKPAGILVDGVTQKVRLPKSEMAPPPAVLGSAEAGFLLGVCPNEGQLLSVLNPRSLLVFDAPVGSRAMHEGAAGDPA